MKFDLEQPKYVLPIILLPFFCLFFYTWHNGFSKPEGSVKVNVGLNGSVGEVSADVRKKQLADKLDAYRNTYKESDGLTAVNAIPKENSSNPDYNNDYSRLQKQKLNSIQQAMKVKFASGQRHSFPSTVDRGDRQIARAVADIAHRQDLRQRPSGETTREKDPMEAFKQQMAVMDSISKQNDPAYREELKKKLATDLAAKIKDSQVRLPVSKPGTISKDFNTVLPEKQQEFINAVIDENVTGYAGSRLRLKLLEDITAGHQLIKKGTPLYAQVSGFSGQRVTLAVNSILYEGMILPVKLEIYDMDGMPGLYVPSSAFRDFSKDLGSNSVHGVTIDGSSGNSQFIMSSLDKVFQSTSSAIAGLIRKNKAKLKYNSYLYLIDTDALHNAQKSESLLGTNEEK